MTQITENKFQREMHKMTGFVAQNYRILKPCIFKGMEPNK